MDLEGLKSLEYGVKTTGYLTGMPTQQAWVTTEGLFDLIEGETDDLRRLFLSKYYLGRDKKKKSSLRLLSNKRKSKLRLLK